MFDLSVAFDTHLIFHTFRLNEHQNITNRHLNKIAFQKSKGNFFTSLKIKIRMLRYNDK